MEVIYYNKGDEQILVAPHRFTAVLKGRELWVDYNKNDLADTVLSIRENRDILREGIYRGIIHLVDIETNNALEEKLYEFVEEGNGAGIGGLAGGIFLKVIEAIKQSRGNNPCQ